MIRQPLRRAILSAIRALGSQDVPVSSVQDRLWYSRRASRESILRALKQLEADREILLEKPHSGRSETWKVSLPTYP